MTVEADVFPLLWSENVDALVDWAQAALGLEVAWTAPGKDGGLEHAEVLWPGGRVSINIRRDEFAHMGPSGIALRYDDRDRVDAVCKRARAAGAEIIQGPGESTIAYSFTAVDPDGNQWWINAETGMLDRLRGDSAKK